MTSKQKTFCDEYLIDLNATQAAIRAGYSPKSAKEQGSRLLTNANVRTHIDKSLAERSKRTGVNADRVIQELAKLAFVNAPDVVDTQNATVRSDASKDDTAAIASVKVKITQGETSDTVEREIRLTDKIKALELLGKHLGMFTDNVNITGDVGVEILNDIPKDKS